MPTMRTIYNGIIDCLDFFAAHRTRFHKLPFGHAGYFYERAASQPGRRRPDAVG